MTSANAASANGTIRLTVGWLRLGLALAILGSITWQVTDRVIHNLFRPGEYFAFFTIQSSLITAVALLLAGVSAVRGLAESRRMTLVRLAAVTALVLVGIVYNALLRGTAPAPADVGYEWPVAPNELLHVWAPILILLDWLLLPALVRLKLRSIFWVLVFPLAWLAFSVIRGVITGWWPYWFIDPTGSGGVAGMVGYIFGIMFFFLFLATLAILLARLVVRFTSKAQAAAN
jgi:hypothetical protein